MGRGNFQSSRGGFKNYGFGQKRNYSNNSYNNYDDDQQEEEKYGESEEFEHRNANRQPLTKRPKVEEAESSASEGAQRQQKSAVRQRFEKAKMKEWRLIIRNLSFKTKKEDMQNLCSNIGPFAEIVLPPSKKDPKMCAGFGFIQFTKKEDAEKGKEFFNSNKVLGRMVAADWALDKDTYETNAHDEKEHL
uniref:RRM domain-containing protein n=1 Tax=Caenorhabditis japonica TaxID=281687 RepID=A0A8R1IQX8_CAEJA